MYLMLLNVDGDSDCVIRTSDDVSSKQRVFCLTEFFINYAGYSLTLFLFIYIHFLIYNIYVV